MPDASGAVDLSASTISDLNRLSDEEQAALEKMAELNPEPSGISVRTAFLVFVETDGTVNVTTDLNVILTRGHLPSSDEIYGAVLTVAKDLQVQETAVNTATAMQQMAQAQMHAMQNARLAQNLNLKG